MKMLCLGKLKFDLRDPDEGFFAKKEFDAFLDTNSKEVKTIPALIKEKPFSCLDDKVIHLITRLPYLGEVQGYVAVTNIKSLLGIVKRITFFREIYILLELNGKDLESTLEKIGLPQDFALNKEDINEYTQIFIQTLKDYLIVVLRFIPFQTLFEYAVEVKKLPAAVFKPRKEVDWYGYYEEKEKGIEKGVNELFTHMREGQYRSPHFGLGKNDIGDFVDWASTSLRKPFLHYLHKYKGKGDPRISRALINLLKVKEGDTILDPFCGSGAFIADASTMGIKAIGIDNLKMACLISKVKCNLSLDLSNLRSHIVELLGWIGRYKDAKERIDIEAVKEKIKLSAGDTRLVRNIQPNLKEIDYIKDFIERIEDKQVKDFLKVCLSQRIVEFSESGRSNNFLNSVISYIEDRYLALYATQRMAERLGIRFSDTVKIIHGDSTNMNEIKDSSIEGILTSPPYFDALDYVGNNKVSTVLLGLEEDLSKIGPEEIEESLQLSLDFSEVVKEKETTYSIHYELPYSSMNLIVLLEEGGRKTKANIVKNYLNMMHKSFKECFKVLKSDKYYLMVISKYHIWKIKGEDRIIDASAILADLGKNVGFKVVDEIEHGLSKADKGKIGIETILVFQK